MRAIPLLLLVACAGAPPSLTGTWDGTVDCGVSLDVSMDLADTEDEGEAEGDGEVRFTDRDGNDVVIEFSAALEFDVDAASPVAVDLDFSSCIEASIGNFTCWAAQDVLWDLEDDEMAGDLRGFPVNDGNCGVEVERVVE